MSHPLYRGLGVASLALLLGTVACGQSETADANNTNTNAETNADSLDTNANSGDLANANTGDETDVLTEPDTAETQDELIDNMPIHEHKDWAAWINLMPGPDAEPTVIVTGQIQLGRAGQTVTLKAMEPQGFNPAILMLEVEVDETIGAEVLTWYDVRYEAPASQGQYTEVSILWNGDMLTTIPVTEAH